jgi:hypothetical protein
MAARISSLDSPCCHSESFAVILSAFAVILSEAKNLALEFSAKKEQGEMLLPQGGISMTYPKVV